MSFSFSEVSNKEIPFLFFINYYKYFIGQNEGIKNLNVIDKKKEQEKDFQDWVNPDADRTKKYGSVLSNYAQDRKRVV